MNPAVERELRVIDARDVGVAAEVLVFETPRDAEPRETLRTDEAGQARAPLPVGARLVAHLRDGRHGTRDVKEGSDAVQVRVYDPVALRGGLRCLMTDVPLADATVTAERLDLPEVIAERLGADGNLQVVATTDTLGRFELAPFRGGRYRLTFSCTGYESLVDERFWNTRTDWDMGTLHLQPVAPLRIRIVGFDPSQPPTVSVGIDGERHPIDAEGRVVVPMPRGVSPQHFSVWLPDEAMMNVYQEGLVEEVDEVLVQVGGQRALEVHVEGELEPTVTALGKPSVRVRFARPPGYKAEWNRHLSSPPPFRADCFDASEASVDLLALGGTWPNVVATTTTALAERGLTEVTLRVPRQLHRLAVRTAEDTPLASDVFVELRRAHDPTRWLASAYPDAAGSVPWPEVPNAAELYCSGVFTWGPPESFFIDLRLPNAPGAGPAAPLALGPSRPHRARVLVDGAGWAGARVQVLGRHTDQLWAFFDTDAEGWTPTFLLTEGSAVDFMVQDSRLTDPPRRTPCAGAETELSVR